MQTAVEVIKDMIENITGRSYYLLSVVVIIIAVAAFMLSFENKKPKAREVVVIAVMTGIAVCGRLVFFMTPQFKPCAAVIIITGIALGKEAGFLTGSLTAFVSAFFFGQGPWVPWQMIAFGIIGVLAAIIFENHSRLSENKVILCIYGFLSTFLIYGFIMDTETVLVSVDHPTAAAFVSVYLSGIIFNIIHGISTVIFLWILAGPFLKKLNRMKVKHGIFVRETTKKPVK